MARLSRKTYADSRGYQRFRNSRTLVHRYVARRKVGRALRWHEVVHHRDGDKQNNDPDNLQVMDRSAHSSYHSRQRENSDLAEGIAVLAGLAIASLGGFLWSKIVNRPSKTR